MPTSLRLKLDRAKNVASPRGRSLARSLESVERGPAATDDPSTHRQAANAETGTGRSLRRLDIRVRREIAHRKLAISILRGFVRVTSLQLVDASLIVAILLGTGAVLPGFAAFWEYAPTIVAIFVLSLIALSAYQAGNGRRDYARLFSGVSLATLILACLVVFPPRLPLQLPLLAVLWFQALVVLVIGREVMDLLVRSVYYRAVGLRRAVMVGGLDEVSSAIERLRHDRWTDQYIEGHLALEDGSDPTALGHVDDLPRVLEERDIREVIVASSIPAEKARWVADRCFEHGAALYMVPAVTEVPQYRIEPLRVGDCPLLRIHPGRLEFPALLLKRGFDLVIASLMLVLSLPVIALIAVAIKLDSPGPVFYRARRLGLGGQHFHMWKFRSMFVDAEEQEKELSHLNIYQGGTFKIRDDPRVTRVGRVLRRTSLDELPQLFNVLRGEMSLVGPRPALISDLERYEPHHYERLSVIPGITGAWQVGGRNLITDFETILRMDRGYIRQWSLLLDIKIMLRTLKVVITGEGAY